MNHLRDFSLDSLTTRAKVAKIQASLMFETVSRPGWAVLRVPA